MQPTPRCSPSSGEGGRPGNGFLLKSFAGDFSRPRISDEKRLDLIYQEVLLREELNERPVVQEYIARFPTLAEELRLQFALDEAIRENRGRCRMTITMRRMQ